MDNERFELTEEQVIELATVQNVILLNYEDHKALEQQQQLLEKSLSSQQSPILSPGHRALRKTNSVSFGMIDKSPTLLRKDSDQFQIKRMNIFTEKKEGPPKWSGTLKK